MKCGKNHRGVCIADFDACFKCGKPGHHVRECRGGARPQGQTQAISYLDQHVTTSGGGQCQNRFYALQTHQELKDPPDIVTGKVNVVADAFSILSMNSVAHIEDEKKELADMCIDVKEKEDSDPAIELKKAVAEKTIEAFS
ncbi:uncharacterized protein LOC129903699 [Solanum dulcamara]|uniref:uncharacterized protein LOC129903699 n=1 Tax=Solanum dulcamara TaxID=45834 RepID=UPI002485D45C|nr:uncharacterized protein LOC129903699 [Solanum dulcamara]